MQDANLQTIRWKLMTQDKFELGAPILEVAVGNGVLEALEKFWASVLGDAFGDYWLIFEEDDAMLLESGDSLELPKCGLDFSDNTIDRQKYRDQMKNMAEVCDAKKLAAKHLEKWQEGGTMREASQILFS